MNSEFAGLICVHLFSLLLLAASIMDYISKSPFDVIESILKEADTRDLQSVIKSSAAFQKVSNESKAPWIVHAQKLLDRCRYLDLPPADSLQDYTIHQLRVAVCKAINLERVWNSENPKHLSVTEEGKLTDHFHEHITALCKLSADRVLYYTDTSYIRVFDIVANAIIAQAHHRERMIFRDCAVTYSENTMNVFCLLQKDPRDFSYDLVFEPEPDELNVLLWNYVLIRINIPKRNMPRCNAKTDTTKIYELSKFRCDGKFKYCTIADISEGFVAVITENEDEYEKYFVHVLQEYEKGVVRSLTIDRSNWTSLVTLKLSPLEHKVIAYEVLPNKNLTRMLEFSVDETGAVNIGEFEREEIHYWSPSGDKFEPLGEEIHCYDVFQGFFQDSYSENPEVYASTACLLKVITPPKTGRGYNPYDYTSWVIMQHYSHVSGEKQRNGQRCIIHLENAHKVYDRDQRDFIPVIHITFNHAAWLQKDEESGVMDVKLATFSATAFNGDNLECIAKASVVTLEFPDSLMEPLIREKISKMVDRVMIDEIQGAVILLSEFNKLFTLYYT